MLITDII